MKPPLKREFFNRDTIVVAQELLGKTMVRVINNKIITGIIVETEAYILDDAACHAFRGQTTANSALFGPAGYAYIYFIYGVYYCVNVVSYSKKQGAGGILIRALEPTQGIDVMQVYRPADKIKNLTNGPGKLTQALAITKELYGHDITKKGDLFITQGVTVPEDLIYHTTRIGLSKAQETPWRFYIRNNPFVSKK